MSATATTRPTAGTIDSTRELSRETLLRVAVARGCRHYAPYLPPESVPIDSPDLPHEMLGVALLRGPDDVDTFQAIRCGAMVLSDLANSPARIVEASKALGVGSRVGHLARIALEADDHPEFWSAIANAFPMDPGEDDFFPGVSRFTSETRLPGPGRPRVRIWLRTHYRR